MEFEELDHFHHLLVNFRDFLLEQPLDNERMRAGQKDFGAARAFFDFEHDHFHALAD